MIEEKPDITHAEVLAELKKMSPKDILAIPLTGRFAGLFETFSEMSKIVNDTLNKQNG